MLSRISLNCDGGSDTKYDSETDLDALYPNGPSTTSGLDVNLGDESTAYDEDVASLSTVGLESIRGQLETFNPFEASMAEEDDTNWPPLSLTVEQQQRLRDDHLSSLSGGGAGGKKRTRKRQKHGNSNGPCTPSASDSDASPENAQHYGMQQKSGFREIPLPSHQNRGGWHTDSHNSGPNPRATDRLSAGSGFPPDCRVWFITSNLRKTRECEQILGRRVEPLNIPTNEIQATSPEIILDTYKQLKRVSRQWESGIYIIDDTSLTIERYSTQSQALPGAYVKQWLRGSSILWSTACGSLATETVSIGLFQYSESADGSPGTFSKLLRASVSVRGRIVSSREAAGSFGYDCYFAPSEWSGSYSEMGVENKLKVCARSRALRTITKGLTMETLIKRIDHTGSGACPHLNLVYGFKPNSGRASASRRDQVDAPKFTSEVWVRGRLIEILSTSKVRLGKDRMTCLELRRGFESKNLPAPKCVNQVLYQMLDEGQVSKHPAIPPSTKPLWKLKI